MVKVMYNLHLVTFNGWKIKVFLVDLIIWIINLPRRCDANQQKCQENVLVCANSIVIFIWDDGMVLIYLKSCLQVYSTIFFVVNKMRICLHYRIKHTDDLGTYLLYKHYQIGISMRDPHSNIRIGIRYQDR